MNKANQSASPLAYPPRVLITKIGLDGHDRGARVVAAALRDAGMEVIYTGPWKQVAEVVSIALEEDVDVIGISSLATDHLLVPRLMKALAAEQLEHVQVMVGGIVPDEDEADLIANGVARVFHPGVSLDRIAEEALELTCDARRKAR